MPKCVGHLSDGSGDQCKRWAIKGGTVCPKHGGDAPQTKAKAQARLLALVDPALVQLSRLLEDGSVPDNVKLGAAKDILDRAGLSAKQIVEVTHHDGDSELDSEIAGLMAKLAPGGQAAPTVGSAGQADAEAAG